VKILKFNCLCHDKIISYKLFGDLINNGHDFYCEASSLESHFDYLCFFDSRGISSGYEGSMVEGLINYLTKKKLSYLIISRPLSLTTWATLYNFLRLNKINASNLITNLGFVDFTPKKNDVLENVINQVNYYMGDVASSKFIQMYESRNGLSIPLYITEYNINFYENVQQMVDQFNKVFIINTPYVLPLSSFPRVRPASFFESLIKTSNFNKKLKVYKNIDLGVIGERETYDAVHYTKFGSKLILDKLTISLS